MDKANTEMVGAKKKNVAFRMPVEVSLVRPLALSRRTLQLRAPESWSGA